MLSEWFRPTPSTEDEVLASSLWLLTLITLKASRQVTHKRAATPPPTLALTHKILTHFGHAVGRGPTAIGHNKLLEETENPIRGYAFSIELFGRFRRCLFTEKAEVTITHLTTEELRESLRSSSQN